MADNKKIVLYIDDSSAHAAIATRILSRELGSEFEIMYVQDPYGLEAFLNAHQSRWKDIVWVHADHMLDWTNERGLNGCKCIEQVRKQLARTPAQLPATIQSGDPPETVPENTSVVDNPYAEPDLIKSTIAAPSKAAGGKPDKTRTVDTRAYRRERAVHIRDALEGNIPDDPTIVRKWLEDAKDNKERTAIAREVWRKIGAIEDDGRHVKLMGTYAALLSVYINGRSR
jgi:hypothetical protein